MAAVSKFPAIVLDNGEQVTLMTFADGGQSLWTATPATRLTIEDRKRLAELLLDGVER